MPRQRVEQLGAIGLMPDPVPSSIPQNAWTSLVNVTTNDGSLRSVRGERKLFNVSVRPLYHATYVGPTGRWYVVVSDGQKVMSYDLISQTEKEITPAADFTGGPVSFTNLNGVMVVNSATDGAFFWDTGAADPLNQILAPLPGWDTDWRCRSIIAFRYFLVALGMKEGNDSFPHKLRWSNSAQEGSLPTEWIPAVTNDAGDDILGETGGVIVGGAVVRDQLYIVKEDAIYSMSWIGGEYVMRVDRLKGGVGTRLERGFAAMQGGMVVFTTTDILFFDGQNSASLVDGKLRNSITNEISEELWERSQVYVHSATSQLFVAGVSAGFQQLSSALVFNYEEGTWGNRRLNFGYGFDEALVTVSADLPSWDELASQAPLNQKYPRMVGGQPWDEQTDGSWNKGVYQPSVPDILLYESNDADTSWWVSVIALSDTDSSGNPKYCRAERVGMPIEGADGMAMVTEVWPEIIGSIPVNISIGGQISDGASPVWDGPYEFIPGVGGSVTPRVTGRFICVRVESRAAGNWNLAALTYQWERAGER
jgi:hypothetical protein